MTYNLRPAGQPPVHYTIKYYRLAVFTPYGYVLAGTDQSHTGRKQSTAYALRQAHRHQYVGFELINSKGDVTDAYTKDLSTGAYVRCQQPLVRRLRD